MNSVTGLRALSLLVAAASLLGVAVAPAATPPTAQAETDRLLKGAIDMHYHMDAPRPDQGNVQAGADIAQVRRAKAIGLRGLMLKDHEGNTAPLAYHLRLEIPDFELFGGVTMNFVNGGINPDAVEHMGTHIKFRTGRMVWMPVGDAQAEADPKVPNARFVAVVGKDGQPLPKVKAVIDLIAKHNLILASGHISAKEALVLFAAAKQAGVKHMVATHAMDLSSVMTMAQMQQAAALGAIIEIDFRNILDENGRRIDAIRALGPEHVLISEFWTRKASPKEYGYPEGVYAFITKMRAKGFTDRELDIMLKDNPARLLDPPLL
jgi:hypothetical protein